mgnify:CR=1 FL=1
MVVNMRVQNLSDMLCSLKGYDFAEAVVFVDDAFVENGGFVVIRLVHVLTNKLLKFTGCHDDSLVGH